MFLRKNCSIKWLVRQSRDLYKRPPTQSQTIASADVEPTSTSRQTPIKSPPHVQSDPSIIRETPFNSTPAQPDSAASQSPTEAVKSRSSSHGFPYIFGGVRDYSDHAEDMQVLFTQKKALLKIYHNFLEACSKKDSKKLEPLVSRALRKPLLNPAVECSFFDSKNEAEVLYHNFSVEVGGGFEKEKLIGLTSYSSDEKIMIIYRSPNYKFTSESTPILVMLNATIISKSKLRLAGEASDDRPEAHCVTFQCESQLAKNKLDFIKAIAALIFLPNPNMSNIRRLILGGEDLKWRIGNIDNYLKSRYQ